MTTVNYPSPVTVNGYSCKNCTDVDYAKKHVDPSHPKDGPYGVDAKNQPSSASATHKASEPKPDSPAVTFSGALAGLSQSSGLSAKSSATQGLRLDVQA